MLNTPTPGCTADHGTGVSGLGPLARPGGVAAGGEGSDRGFRTVPGPRPTHPWAASPSLAVLPTCAACLRGRADPGETARPPLHQPASPKAAPGPAPLSGFHAPGGRTALPRHPGPALGSPAPHGPTPGCPPASFPRSTRGPAPSLGPAGQTSSSVTVTRVRASHHSRLKPVQARCP